LKKLEIKKKYFPVGKLQNKNSVLPKKDSTWGEGWALELLADWG
jgi:hypothetical protein